MEEIVSYALLYQNAIKDGHLFIWKDEDGKMSYSTNENECKGDMLIADFKIVSEAKPYTKRDFEWQLKNLN